MKKIINILLSIAAALSLLTGCVEGPATERLQVLNPSVESLVAPFMGAEYEIEINSNTAWKLVKGEANWYTVPATEFVGTMALKVNILPNDGEERKDVITITSRDGSIVKEIPVIQQSSKTEGYLSISSVRALEAAEAQTLSGTGSKVKGFIITDNAGGNWTQYSFAIEDNFTDINSGLAVIVAADGYEAFKVGDEVEVELDGSVLKRDEKGRLVLETASLPAKTVTNSLSAIKPIAITPAVLAKGEYESMYVKVENIQVQNESDGGSEVSKCPVFTDENSDVLQLIVSEEASFAYDECLSGAGYIAGIAGPASATPTIAPVSSSDISLSTLRFGVLPGIKALPYVFSLYSSEFTGKDTASKPKYVDFFPLSYNEETCMVKGMIAKDKDLNNGAFLEMAAYGSDASKISDNGPRMESDIAGHDYIKCSGFVSLDCKTTPTEECGWYFTLPLMMEMPQDFTVTFGLGSAKYSLGDWDMFWSVDKENWTKVGRASMTVVKWPDHYGFHFFSYTLPVHLDAPVPAKSNLYLKWTPQGTRAADDKTGRDGHGNSCYIWFHSGIVISQEVKGNTAKPSGAVYFEAFDNLVGGVDYFIGDRLAAFANHPGKAFAEWADDQKNGLSGENVCERPGYAQIGFVDTEIVNGCNSNNVKNNVGKLTTPVLGQAGNLKLSFKAAAYKSNTIRMGADDSVFDVGSPDLTSIMVEILGGGTIDGKTSVEVSGLPTDRFGEFSLNVIGATANTQICFTSSAADGQYSRWFIDEISVTK